MPINFTQIFQDSLNFMRNQRKNRADFRWDFRRITID